MNDDPVIDFILKDFDWTAFGYGLAPLREPETEVCVAALLPALARGERLLGVLRAIA